MASILQESMENMSPSLKHYYNPYGISIVTIIGRNLPKCYSYINTFIGRIMGGGSPYTPPTNKYIGSNRFLIGSGTPQWQNILVQNHVSEVVNSVERKGWQNLLGFVWVVEYFRDVLSYTLLQGILRQRSTLPKDLFLFAIILNPLECLELFEQANISLWTYKSKM